MIGQSIQQLHIKNVWNLLWDLLVWDLLTTHREVARVRNVCKKLVQQTKYARINN